MEIFYVSSKYDSKYSHFLIKENYSSNEVKKKFPFKNFILRLSILLSSNYVLTYLTQVFFSLDLRLVKLIQDNIVSFKK